MARFSAPFILFFALCAILFLNGCSGVESEAKYPTSLNKEHSTTEDPYEEAQSIFGKNGLGLFGKKEDEAQASGVTVNSFLWRGALDAVSFMPLASADPFGGVILTDWYAPEDSKERFKVNVFILGKQLRSDGIRVRVFKQVKSGNAWKDVDASEQTARDLEDTILTRARQLRVAQLDN